jgi:hypothetical protein
LYSNSRTDILSHPVPRDSVPIFEKRKQLKGTGRITILQSTGRGDPTISLIFIGFPLFPHGPLLAIFTVGKTERTWENGEGE